MIKQALLDYTKTLKQQGLYRKRIVANPIANDMLINFSSNDYLSLCNHKAIKKAYQKGFANYPSGSGGSMLVCGYHPIHKTLERQFVQALGVDDAILFTSGYAANLSILYLISQLNVPLLIDKAIHASFYDGLKLTGQPYIRYMHNNLDDLAQKLSKLENNPVVLCESVFSMSGHATNLTALISQCKTQQATCLVDEAHAFGVFGPQGLGAIVLHQLTQQDIPLRIIPFGKALASQGAIVAGEQRWIDALLQAARPTIYSTALSPALAYGLLKSFDLLRLADARREKLMNLIAYFRYQCQNSPFLWRESSTPIHQLQLGCPHLALDYANFLLSKGIFCLAMRSPTVTKKETGLRVILNYHHEPEQIDYLFLLLQQKYDSTPR